MNTKDKDSLTALLNYTKEYQSISREIHWTFSDSERLDDLVNSKDLQKDIANRIRRLGQRKSAEFIVPFFLAYKAWQRTKAVYSFNQKLIADLANADDTNIYISLLERLPFKDMLFFFPEGALTKFDNEEIAGVYVHIERHPEFLWILINNLNRNPDNKNQILPGFGIAFPISNGMKISDIFKTPQYLDWLSSHKRQMAFNPLISEQKLEETILSEKKALNTVINCLYYLSAENADIKEIKNRKKLKKASSSPNGDNMPAIKLHEVGTKYAEIVYRRLRDNPGPAEDTDDQTVEDSVTQSTKTYKKRRPHARRAHWQHYWIGKGRTELVLRWKDDSFVGTNRDDQAVIVYDMADSLKGKLNPNTSKKKRKKK